MCVSVPLFSLKSNKFVSITGATAPPRVTPESRRLMRRHLQGEASDHGFIMGAADLLLIPAFGRLSTSLPQWVVGRASRVLSSPKDPVTSDLSPNSEKSLPLHSNCLQRHSPFSFSPLPLKIPNNFSMNSGFYKYREVLTLVKQVLLPPYKIPRQQVSKDLAKASSILFLQRYFKVN